MRRSGDLKHVLQVLRAGARAQPAIEQRLRPVDNDLGGIEIVLAAQPVTFRTSAVSAVKRERAWFQQRDVDAAIRTRQPRRRKRLLPAHHRDLHQTARQFHRQPDRHLQPMFNAGLHQQAIDHDFNGVVLSLIEIDFIFKIDQFAIDTSPGEAVLDQLLHLFFELALAPTHNRSHDHDAIFRGQGHHSLDDLLGGLARDRPPAFRAMRNPYRGVEKAKVVIDLGWSFSARSKWLG